MAVDESTSDDSLRDDSVARAKQYNAAIDEQSPDGATRDAAGDWLIRANDLPMSRNRLCLAADSSSHIKDNPTTSHRRRIVIRTAAATDHYRSTMRFFAPRAAHQRRLGPLIHKLRGRRPPAAGAKGRDTPPDDRRNNTDCIDCDKSISLRPIRGERKYAGAASTYI